MCCGGRLSPPVLVPTGSRGLSFSWMPPRTPGLQLKDFASLCQALSGSCLSRSMSMRGAAKSSLSLLPSQWRQWEQTVVTCSSETGCQGSWWQWQQHLLWRKYFSFSTRPLQEVVQCTVSGFCILECGGRGGKEGREGFSGAGSRSHAAGRQCPSHSLSQCPCDHCWGRLRAAPRWPGWKDLLNLDSTKS